MRADIDIPRTHAHFGAGPMFIYYAAQNVHGPLDTAPAESIGTEPGVVVDALTSEIRQMFGSLLASLDQSVGSMVDAFKSKG